MDCPTSVQGDIGDPAWVDRLVADSDLVVHLAAESHDDNSPHEPSLFSRGTWVGTFVVLGAVRKLGVRLHLVSTDVR